MPLSTIYYYYYTDTANNANTASLPPLLSPHNSPFSLPLPSPFHSTPLRSPPCPQLHFSLPSIHSLSLRRHPPLSPSTPTIHTIIVFLYFHPSYHLPLPLPLPLPPPPPSPSGFSPREHLVQYAPAITPSPAQNCTELHVLLHTSLQEHIMYVQGGDVYVLHLYTPLHLAPLYLYTLHSTLTPLTPLPLPLPTPPMSTHTPRLPSTTTGKRSD